MEIKKTNAIHFGTAIHLKTNSHEVLEKIEDADSTWRSLSNPTFRFVRTSGNELEKDGFIHGILCDAEEKDAIHGMYKLGKKNVKTFEYKNLSSWPLLESIANSAKQVIVNSVEELEKLPIFKMI